MTEARITAVAGGMLAAVFAMWFLGELYHLCLADLPSDFPKTLGLWWVGIPLTLSCGIATFLMTRKHDWLPSRWTRRSLGVFLARSVLAGTMIYIPLQVLVVLPLALAPMPHYQSTPGMPDAFLFMLACLVLVIFIVGQVLALVLARCVATGIAREEQRLFGSKDSDEQR